MGDIVDLDTYKDKQKIKIVTKDLERILSLFDMSISGLKQFSKYTPAHEVITLMMSNRHIVKKYIEKFNNITEEE